MKIKIKSFIIISIVILSGLIINFNFDLNTIGSENDSDAIREIEPEPLSGDDLNWSKIEVLSEPIPGQDNNINLSHMPAVAIENDKIYVVWADLTDYNGAGSDSDIFYRFFNGSSWSEIQVISEPVPGQNFNNGNSFFPKIAVESGKIYVAWADMNNTNGAGTDNDIFYRCNLTGSSWEPVQVISEPVFGKDYNTEWKYHPAIAVDNGNVYVVWRDANNTNGAGTDIDIFYRSNLTGKYWEPIQVISESIEGSNTNIVVSGYPSIAVENSKIYVVWNDYNNTNGAGIDSDIFYRYNFTGINWESTQVISEPVPGQDFNTGDSGWPAIAVKDGKIYVVWHDDNNTNGAGTDDDIFYRCNISGLSWEDTQVISEPVPGQNFNTGITTIPGYYAGIKVENGNIFIVWCDNNNTNGAGTDLDIFHRCNLTGIGWEDTQVISEPVPGQNFNTGDSELPVITVNSRICVVWRDENNTNGAGTDWDIFYRWIYLPIALSLPKVTPNVGNTSTYFNFTLKYQHFINKAPTKITVNISGTEYPLMEVDPADTNFMDGKDYYLNITHLEIGVNTHQFWASDGINLKYTKLFNLPIVYNTPPDITTEDNLTAIEDVYYEVSYEYEDIDIANVGQVGYWNFSTNASWLAFDFTTAILNGTPTNDDVGKYWVNITINDSIDMDFTNFTLTVININDNPMINTSNIEITNEDTVYFIDYNATDIDSPIENQIWALDTNATSWLDIDSATGIISGTPTNDDVGDYWINVSVEDGDDGLAYTNYTLIVLNVNDRPEIITEDELIANVNILYQVDYNATDIDSPLSQLIWLLDTNATWLNIDSSTGVLTGTPSNSDLGWFNINVSVDDGDGGEDWHEFILSVITEGSENEPPVITTIDKVSITAGESYIVIYEATDDRTPIDSLIWSLNSNASWLSFIKASRLLSGSPTLANVGWYWVNVTVGDGEGGFDSHNFTLTVYITANQPPDITTVDDVNAVVGEIYTVDYEATDDRTPVNYLNWSLETNASWLTMHRNTGLLSGTPSLSDIGWYTINVTVFDGEDGWDYHNFVLTVTTEPIKENNAPELSDPTLTPSEGDVETEFTFIVHYYDEDSDVPSSIRVFIDNGSYDMTLKEGEDPVNGIYTVSTKLSEGNHTYYFTAFDGIDPATTNTYSTPYINKVTDIDGGKPKKDTETDWWIWVLIIVIIIIVVLILLFLFILKKKSSEEPSEGGRLPEEPPPTPDVEPEQPLEEVPSEAPPEQPSPPEAPPEQPLQEVPQSEVTPQVPQVEEQPVEQPPTPTVEPQVVTEPQPVPTPQLEPQVEPQEPVVEQPAEPQQQPPTPTIKTHPTIDEEVV